MTETVQCTRVHVKPCEGRAVRMPERQHQLMPPEGMEVPHNVYWRRRLAVGDVEIVQPAAKAAATKGVKSNGDQ